MSNDVEMQFRDGPRVVPPHVADYLFNVDTLLHTYREAMVLADRNRLSEHFKDMREF